MAHPNGTVINELLSKLTKIPSGDLQKVVAFVDALVTPKTFDIETGEISDEPKENS